MTDERFFQRQRPFSIGKLAELLQADLVNCNNPELEICDVSPLQVAQSGHLSFFDNAKYLVDFTNTTASACIVAPDFVSKAPPATALLVRKDPYRSYAKAAMLFYPEKISTGVIHTSAVVEEKSGIGLNVSIGANSVIEDGVQIGANTQIGSNCTITRNVVIGEGCRIASNVSITHSLVGDNVTIHAGARLGEDGFGFSPDPSGHLKIPQLGRVVIGNGVVIGANSTIDRGSGPDTVIGDGTWIDNLVQIGHNVVVGKGCILVSQVGISGSATLEDFVVLGGQAGVAGHLTIGMGTQIGAKSGVLSNIPAGQTYAGFPALPRKEFFRMFATLRKLARKGIKP